MAFSTLAGVVLALATTGPTDGFLPLNTTEFVLGYKPAFTPNSAQNSATSNCFAETGIKLIFRFALTKSDFGQDSHLLCENTFASRRIKGLEQSIDKRRVYRKLEAPNNCIVENLSESGPFSYRCRMAL